MNKNKIRMCLKIYTANILFKLILLPENKRNAMFLNYELILQ